MQSGSLRFRALGGSGALAMATMELALRVPALREPSFITSITAIFERDEYGAFLVERASQGENWSRVGVGLFCVYQDHWVGRPKLAVEGACFEEAGAAVQQTAWAGLIGLAGENGLDALYLKLETIAPTEPLQELLRIGGWDHYVVRYERQSVMQASSDGIWSAFMGTTKNQAAFVDCVRVQEPIDVPLTGARVRLP